MSEERVFIEKNEERQFIEKLRQKNILGFNTLDNIEIYLFFASLGCNDPKPVPHKDGFVRVDTDRKTDLKARLSSFLLSEFKNDSELDDFCDIKKCLEYSDKCSYAGYLKFKEIYEKSENEEALLKKLIIMLNEEYYEIFEK